MWRTTSGRLFGCCAARLTPCAPTASLGAAGCSSLLPSEVDQIARLVENDPRILMEVIAHLNPQTRRRLVVTGGAMEWFGRDSAAREVEEADVDKDRQISPKDFDHWFESALKRKNEDKTRRAETRSALSVPAGSSSGAHGRVHELPFRTLFLIAVEAGLPFVGFGFLDNTTMILAGDLIDGTLGLYLHCSVLASVAMGNICSGLLGMQVHGLIDRAVQRFHINALILTEEQMKDRRVFAAGHLGATVGIMIGLVLGMLPLLFLHGDPGETSDGAVLPR